MLQTSNYSLVLSLQFLLLSYDLFVNSFSELLRKAPVIQLVLFIIQDMAILFNIIIIFLMFFNTFVFQAGLVNLLFHKFKGTIILTAVYFALSISLHVWVMNLRWKNSNSFIWTDGLQTLFVFQRLEATFAVGRESWPYAWGNSWTFQGRFRPAVFSIQEGRSSLLHN
ncbi:transmembrane protein 138 isoform X5 [Symphalangus syndactylus]|uniref:transmembrane protein 138 isoform X5 n=1 Tax=Symphalangus syndactylus TaxID=9590 RepID=UPI0030045CF8